MNFFVVLFNCLFATKSLITFITNKKVFVNSHVVFQFVFIFEDLQAVSTYVFKRFFSSYLHVVTGIAEKMMGSVIKSMLEDIFLAYLTVFFHFRKFYN